MVSLPGLYPDFMFYGRKKSEISLVGIEKATTFAPALREKHSTTCKTSFKKTIKLFFKNIWLVK